MSETAGMSLTEFLTARIKEDEQMANLRDRAKYGPPIRALRETEAKRRIVEASRSYHEGDQNPGPDDPDGGWALSIALRALAAVYADHPDYRDEWRQTAERW